LNIFHGFVFKEKLSFSPATIYIVIAENQPTIHLPIEFLRKVKIKIYKTLNIMSNIVPDYFKELGEKNLGS